MVGFVTRWASGSVRRSRKTIVNDPNISPVLDTFLALLLGWTLLTINHLDLSTMARKMLWPMNHTGPPTPSTLLFEILSQGPDSAKCSESMLSYFTAKLGREVVGVEPKILEHGVFHVVYGLLLRDHTEPPCVARIRYNFTNTDLGIQEARRQIKQEADLLSFLATSAPDLLAPRLLAIDPDPNNPIQAPFTIETRLGGQNLLQLSCTESFAGFDWELFLTEYTRALHQVFNVELPGSIGIIEGFDDRGHPRIGPITEDAKSPGGPFTSLQQYMDWRIRSIVVETTDNLNVDTDALIDRLCSLSTRLCDRISSDSNVLLTPRLVHGDPHDRNCLVDNGRFSGLVDWESHYILPTCLAAEYPPYIRYDGMREQRYAAMNEYGDIEFMNSHMVRPSIEEATHLRALILEISRTECPLYAQALEEGRTLRQLLEWITFVDWTGEYVWRGLELWEEDQRIALDALTS